jgi:hypothetical protein
LVGFGGFKQSARVLNTGGAWKSRDGAGGPLSVEISHDGELVARYARCYGRGHQILDLEHYLDVLEKEAGSNGGLHPIATVAPGGAMACLSGSDLARS